MENLESTKCREIAEVGRLHSLLQDYSKIVRDDDEQQSLVQRAESAVRARVDFAFLEPVEFGYNQSFHFPRSAELLESIRVFPLSIIYVSGY
jgi:hypothetical protein